MIETSDEYNIINPYELTFIVSTDYFEKEFGSYEYRNLYSDTTT